jgi:hypothetical protein
MEANPYMRVVSPFKKKKCMPSYCCKYVPIGDFACKKKKVISNMSVVSRRRRKLFF